MRQGKRLMAVMAMRYDDLGGESVSEYLRRAYRRQYRADVFGHPSLLDATLGSKLVYMGDLFFETKISGSQLRLMA